MFFFLEKIENKNKKYVLLQPPKMFFFLLLFLGTEHMLLTAFTM